MKQSNEAKARETLRRLMTRKTLTVDDYARGVFAGLFLIEHSLEQIAAFTVEQARRDFQSEPTHTMHACAGCGFIQPLAFDESSNYDDRAALARGTFCGSCGETGTLQPLPKKVCAPS